MKIKENDPDTLQILDELDEEWVEHWLAATNKKNTETNLTTIVYPQEEIQSRIAPKKPRFSTK